MNGTASGNGPGFDLQLVDIYAMILDSKAIIKVYTGPGFVVHWRTYANNNNIRYWVKM